jgi:hypothetical protein
MLTSAASGLAAPTDLPDPCTVVPSALIASAMGLKKAPPATLSTVTNVSTCAYKGGLLTISVGYTALTNPTPPATLSKVAGLPNGRYETYTGSTQTEVTFVKGTTATGLYAVVRNFGRIPKKKLVKIAEALYKGLGSATGSGKGSGLVP